ncbi:hypothetical protein HHI36_018585, partial [Cryptolaemus montrouzieri]
MTSKWTWSSPDCRTKKAIDFVISDRKDIVKDVSEIDNTLEYNENMSVNILFENIKNTITNAKGIHYHKTNEDQKLNQRTKLLIRRRREMSDKTAEYRSINLEIAKEMRKFRRVKNQKEIKT